MPYTNWLAPTSKSGTKGSWVIWAGGRAVRKCWAWRKHRGWWKRQNQSKLSPCKTVFSAAPSTLRRGMTRRVPQRGQCEHILDWAHLWGKSETPAEHLWRWEKVCSLFWSAVFKRCGINIRSVERASHFGQIAVGFVARATFKRFRFVEH